MLKPATNTKGFTILEMMLIISVIIGVLGIIAYSAGPFKESQNTATCISNMDKLNKAIKAGAAIYGIEDGTPLSNYRQPIFGNSSGLVGRQVSSGYMNTVSIKCKTVSMSYLLRAWYLQDGINVSCRYGGNHLLE